MPYQQAPHHIFRIGAASSRGQRDPLSEDTKRINFTSPETRFKRPSIPTRASSLSFSGASVATALATGLASLIIYCAVIVKIHLESQGQDATEFKRKADGLKERDNLDAAFKSIKARDWRDPKFLPVWKYFPDATFSMNNAKERHKVTALSELVRKLSKDIL